MPKKTRGSNFLVGPLFFPSRILPDPAPTTELDTFKPSTLVSTHILLLSRHKQADMYPSLLRISPVNIAIGRILTLGR